MVFKRKSDFQNPASIKHFKNSVRNSLEFPSFEKILLIHTKSMPRKTLCSKVSARQKLKTLAICFSEILSSNIDYENALPRVSATKDSECRAFNASKFLTSAPNTFCTGLAPKKHNVDLKNVHPGLKIKPKIQN